MKGGLSCCPLSQICSSLCLSLRREPDIETVATLSFSSGLSLPVIFHFLWPARAWSHIDAFRKFVVQGRKGSSLKRPAAIGAGNP